MADAVVQNSLMAFSNLNPYKPFPCLAGAFAGPGNTTPAGGVGVDLCDRVDSGTLMFTASVSLPLPPQKNCVVSTIKAPSCDDLKKALLEESKAVKGIYVGLMMPYNSFDCGSCGNHLPLFAS